ncbi:hypothetical protein [Nesterenkonia sp.]|uniref:variant leucine-rich repeat-containing protein n=1 Tax=Nesterenkonia sp. TaxID=704201 RepID=UPI00262B1A60|nr:hypothetical protein [Nesterenkonia sp.]
MTENDDAAELEALAANPRTDWDVLHWIAENHPELRPTIAANPGTYQELVDALGQLGDPAIDAAIAMRHRGRDVSSAAAATNPLAGMYDTYTQGIPAYQDEGYEDYYQESEPGYSDQDYSVQDDAAQHDAAQDYAAQDYAADEYAAQPPHYGPDEYGISEDEAPAHDAQAHASPAHAAGPSADHGPEDPTPTDEHQATHARPEDATPASEHEAAEPEPQDEPDPAVLSPAADPAVYGEPADAAPASSDGEDAYPESEPYGTPEGTAPAGAAAAARPEEDEQKEQQRASLLLVGAAIAAVVGIGLVMVLLISLLGGEDETPPVAEPTTSPTQEPTEQETEPAQEEPTEEEEPAEEDSVDEEALAEARAAVAELPDATTCETSEDAGTVAEFIAAGAAAEDFPGGDDADLLEETFSSLQSECSATHAAGVFEAARSGDQAPENGAEALTAVGTDWVNRYMPAGDAEQMSSFEIHDGNIQCEFDDGLRCTVYDHNYAAPEGCEDGTTYRMQVDGGGAEVDCDNPVEEADREALAEESSATDGFLVCLNTSNRISCYNSVDGSGFELSETGHYSLNY